MPSFEVKTGQLDALIQEFLHPGTLGFQLGSLVRKELVQGLLGISLPDGGPRDDFIRSSKALDEGRRKLGWRRGELVEIRTSDDAHVCKRCRALAAGSPYPIEVARKQLPHHPGAVLEGSTFASYGSILEMARAWFDGPAVRLRTSRKTVSVGPNHPVLTKRGFVPARLLHEGDQLLYDTRMEGIAVPTPFIGACDESNFKDIPMTEDVFESLASSWPLWADVGAPHDFHGDRAFCDGEVEIVFPAWRLLSICDVCGFEQLGERHFPRPNMQLFSEFIFSTLPQLFGRVLHSFGSSMSGSDLLLSLSGGHSRPFDEFLFGSGSFDVGLGKISGYGSPADSELFGQAKDAFSFLVGHNDGMTRWDTVLDVHLFPFSGWAFDASTSSGIYNSDGYVVKNCRCYIVSQFFLGRRSKSRPLARAGAKRRSGHLRWSKSVGHRIKKTKRPKQL